MSSSAFRAPLPHWDASESNGPKGCALKLTPDGHVLIEVGAAGIILSAEDAAEMGREMRALALESLRRKRGN